MISSEVQRTLVKSPPELWAELSDPTALARHLGELGEIRIIRTEPESTVEWAAENTTGTVSIKPSGWGTKVTLSATREITERAPALQNDTAPQPIGESPDEVCAPPQAESMGSPSTDAPATPAVESESESVSESASEAASATEPASVPEHEAASATEPTSDPGAASKHELEAISEPEPEPEPVREAPTRRGFFARLFARRRKPEHEYEPFVEDSDHGEVETPLSEPSVAESPSEHSDAFAAVRQVLAPETFAASHPFAALPAAKAAAETSAHEPETRSEPIGDIAAELMAAEEVTAEEVTAEVTAVLTAVLDRLGAAHHRPFSRA